MKLCTKHTQWHDDILMMDDILRYWHFISQPSVLSSFIGKFAIVHPKAAQLFKILQTGKNANEKITIATKSETRVETAWRFHNMKTISEM